MDKAVRVVVAAPLLVQVVVCPGVCVLLQELEAVGLLGME